jgi:RNA polymerase sigma-70 factor (ECF subfamily)
MEKTPASLLVRLRNPSDSEAWVRFVELYTPLLFTWAHRLGLREQDAADLVQDVLTLLLEKLPHFAYDERQRFRGWLWTLVRNRWASDRRRAAAAGRAAAELAREPSRFEPNNPVDEAEACKFLVGRAARLLQREFSEKTWKAFWECLVQDRPAAEVAAELDLSVGAVHTAKWRVLRRLRQELAGLID